MSQSTSETKIAISPKSKYAVTYENNLFKGWSNAEFSHAELTIEPQSTLILDFKVSDNKVLIYKTLYEGIEDKVYFFNRISKKKKILKFHLFSSQYVSMIWKTTNI